MLKATIYRRENLFIKFPSELKTDIKRKIGSTFVSDTKDVLRGLNKDEEKLYLPDIIGVQPTSEQWNAAVRDYWLNYTIDVPEKGKELIIGKDENGTPINLPDYIAYNFANKHVDVASTDEQLQNKEAFPYYMIDSAKEEAIKVSKFELGVRADKAYVSLFSEDKANKARWVYDLIRDKDQPISPSADDLMMLLKEIKDTKPALFVNTMKDKDIETKFLINQFIRSGVLTKEGNSYFDGDKLLGNEAELIGFLVNPANQADKLKMEQRLHALSV
jgi:hypothetical protein